MSTRTVRRTSATERERFACGRRDRGPLELESGGVPVFEHVGRHSDFNPAAIPGERNKGPDGRWPGVEPSQVLIIQRRNKPVGIDPDPDAFDEDVAVDRQRRMQVGAEHAVVLGINPAQVHAQPGHGAAAVGQQDQIRRQDRERRGSGGSYRCIRGRRGQKSEGGLKVPLRGGVTFEPQFGVAERL